MIRGTTAQFKFKLPFPKEELYWVTIKFWQPGNPSPYLPITRKLEHCDTPNDSTELHVSLTAEETQRFSEKYKAKVQIRGQHTASGTVFGNRPQLLTIYSMNDDILEENPMLPTPDDKGWIIFDGGNIVEQ